MPPWKILILYLTQLNRFMDWRATFAPLGILNFVPDPIKKIYDIIQLDRGATFAPLDNLNPRRHSIVYFGPTAVWVSQNGDSFKSIRYFFFFFYIIVLNCTRRPRIPWLDLYCIALYCNCIVLYCIVLYCTILYYIVFYNIAVCIAHHFLQRESEDQESVVARS